MDFLTDGRGYSVGAALVVVVIVLMQWRVILSASLIGIFCTGTLAFTILGLLIMPWVRAHLPLWFPRLQLDGITGCDYLYADLLMVGGLALVLTAYQASHALCNRGRLCRVGPRLTAPMRTSRVDFSLAALVTATMVALAASVALMVQYRSQIAMGLIEGFLGANPVAMFVARREVGENYALFQLVQNVLPYYAVAMWLVWRVTGHRRIRRAALVVCLASAVMLVFLFQKRPLLVFLLMLGLLSAWRPSWRRGLGHGQRPARPRASATRIVLFGSSLFALLCVLYFFSTTVTRGAPGGLMEAACTLGEIALTRVVGRLALPVPMYTHVFPTIHDYYGLSNVGLFGRLWGAEFFPDTFYVFSVFSNSGISGSAAVPALGDFYGQFGFTGWFIGACLIGVALQWGDSILVRVRDRPSGVLLIMAAMAFAYYLTQANLPRALLGYGGVVFLAQWLLLVPACLSRTWRRARPVAPAGAASAAEGATPAGRR